MKTHYRNVRLRNNAGISFPECYSQQDLLDLDKGRLETTGDVKEVTCLHCLHCLQKDGKLTAEQVEEISRAKLSV